MKTLILFSTRDGQTREIASFLASELKELGIDADTLNLNRTDVVEWHHYDRVVIGASIRYGHFHPAVDRFVKSIWHHCRRCREHSSLLTWWRVNPRSARRRPTAIRVSFC